MLSTFIFDLDGTIVTQGKPVTEELAHSIWQLTTNHKVIFASARPVRDMLPLLPNKLQDCLMVGCNGGMAWQQGNCLVSHVFQHEIASALILFLQQKNIPYVADGHWHYAVSPLAHPFHAYMHSLSDQQTTIANILAEGLTKLLILDNNARQMVNEYLLDQGLLADKAKGDQLTVRQPISHQLTIHQHKADNLFDIIPQQENKYLSLLALGVNFSQAAVFGNDENDYAMLDKAHISIFLGDKAHYPHADWYCATEDIPVLLDKLLAKESLPLR